MGRRDCGGPAVGGPVRPRRAPRRSGGTAAADIPRRRDRFPVSMMRVATARDRQMVLLMVHAARHPAGEAETAELGDVAGRRADGQDRPGLDHRRFEAPVALQRRRSGLSAAGCRCSRPWLLTSPDCGELTDVEERLAGR